MEAEKNTWSLPIDYLEFADYALPNTSEESLGTYCSEWTIKQLSKLNSRVNGPSFKTDTMDWNVLLFPRGNDQQQYISLYLENEACRKKTAIKDVCVQFILCIVDPTDPTRFYHKESQHRYNEYEADWGFTQYMDRTELQDYIVNDTVKLTTIIRIIKDPTGVLWHNFYNYDSKKMTGHVGLLNQGATCYMNSLFQSLFFTNIYRKAVFQIPTENEDPTQSMALAMQRIFYQLQFSSRAVSTTELTKSFGWDTIESFMQHDIQEFNRLLQDTMEIKMQNTPAEGTIQSLFRGKMKSYIQCIHVDYESTRTEHYYDIQLNVKGCKDLHDSFREYVVEEILEGENQYKVDELGFQDARKGVCFESFPPVLHLQLKRFGYDMQKDCMVKINDRYEFPSEIDLKSYLPENTTEPSNYILHGVMVHKGDIRGGHYFAFVRPTKEDQWLKFNDDRVTPATLREVLEDNYGGYSNYGNKTVFRNTNAYMLVYVRESKQHQLFQPVTQNDIPLHLVTRIQEEEEYQKRREKQESEKHLYMRLYIADDQSFLMNEGPDFVTTSSDYNEPPPYVQVRQVLRTQSLKEFLMSYSKEKGIEYHIWYLVRRVNGSVRLDARFKNEDLALGMEEACKRISRYPFLRFYMEPILKQEQEDILVFIKFYDPVVQSLSAIGKLYINKDDLVSSIENDINLMIGFEQGTELEIYEEINASRAELLDKEYTFEQNQIYNGDILCAQIPHQTNIQDYLNYLVQRVQVVFYGNEKEPFQLVLGKDMLYERVLEIVGEFIGHDPEYLQLFVPNIRGEMQRIKPMLNLSLKDILQLVPQQNNTVMFKCCEPNIIKQ